MKKITIELYRICLLILYTMTFLALFFSLLKSDYGIGMSESIDPISISGTVSVDNGPEEEILETLWNDGIRHSVVVFGHFNRSITDGDSLIIWPRNLRVKIFVNGIEKICTGQREAFPDFIEYAGNSYQIFYIGEVSTKDLIRIEIVKAYDSCRINVINSFFDNLYVGRESAVFQSIMSHELIHPLIGLTLSFLGVLILFTSLTFNFYKYSPLQQVHYLGWFFIIAGISYVCDSSYEFIDLLFPYVVLNTLIDLCSIPLLLFFYLLIISNALQNHKTKLFMRWLSSIFVILELIPIFLQLVGIRDLHVMQDLYVLVGEAMALLALCTIIYEMLFLKNKDLKKILIATLPLIVSLSFKTINVILEHGVERSYIRMGILLSSALLFHSTFSYLKRSAELVEQEEQMKKEVQNAQVAIMLSQIQPHFLYNTLNALQHICKKDGALAAEALEHFSRYLRGNLDSLTTNHPIPFESELDHVKHYLYIEQLRFGDRVRVKYDLEVTNFYIPTLTLQPIVENAIRHGITKKAEGGLVTIATSFVQNEIWIIVSDNGIGFDGSNYKEENRSHIGIENVKKRLMLQCNGTIDMTSAKGIGTTVTIRMKGVNSIQNESNGH